jgi:multidrug resistance efflux pump
MSSPGGLDDLTLLRQTLAGRPAPVARLAAALGTAVVAAAIVWAATTRAALVVRGPARVRPADGAIAGGLTGGADPMAAPEPGRIARLLVRDGERVGAGAPLYAFDTELLELEQARLRAAIALRETQVAALERLAIAVGHQGQAANRALAAELTATRADEQVATRRTDAAISAAALAVTAARAEATRLTALVAQGAAPAVDLERARRRVEEAEVEATRAALGVGGRRSAVIAGQLERSGHDAEVEAARLAHQRTEAELALAGARAELARIDAAWRRRTVHATTAGVVMLQPGIAVGVEVVAGQSIVAIVPDRGLRVDAAIPARAVAALRVGRPVTIRLDAQDERLRRPLTGTITYIAPDAELVRDGDRTAARYLVSIALSDDPRLARLRPGMVGEVAIITGHRRVLGLVFDRVQTAVDL